MISRGRVAIPRVVTVSEPIELSQRDLLHLAAPRSPPTLKRIRTHHHQIAKALAYGMLPTEIVAVFGISRSGLAKLEADPCMQDLVLAYRDEKHTEDITAEAIRDAVVRNTALKMEFMIADRVDEAFEGGEPMPFRDMLAYTADRHDRTGFVKSTQSLNVNIGLAARLEQRHAERRMRRLAMSLEPSEVSDA